MRARCSRRHRLRLVWLLLASLLLQQVALAAHACGPAFALVPGDGAAATEHCAGTPPPAAEHGDDALCQQHCDPERAATSDPAPASFPPLPPAQALPVVALHAPAAAGLLPRHSPAAVDPPPTLRFCSLLI